MSPQFPSSGTSQEERFPPALDPASAPLDARDDLQLAAAGRRFASGLEFWNSDGNLNPNTDWADFFPDPGPGTTQKAQAALFHAFLHLHRHALGDLNALTGRHLDFHYRQVLRLLPQAARPDRAHLVLKLKKSTTEARIPADTLFTTAAGIRYRSTAEIFVRQTLLAHLRLIHRAADGTLRHAPIANSGDGLGSDLPAEDPSWHPFGAGRQLPPATTGFALSSPVLLLREGKRTITVALSLAFPGTPPADASLKNFFENSATVELSGAKSWLRATGISLAILPATGNSRRLEISCHLDGDAEPVVAYDPTLLVGGYDTVAPVMKFAAAGDASPAVRTALATAAVTGISIRVAVEGMKDVKLENDHGRLDPSKPFLPFGPQPRAGSSFYIGAEEALAKRVNAAVLNIEWAGVPANLATHYAAYKNSSGSALVPSNSHFTARFQILRQGRFENLSPASEALFDPTDATKAVAIDSSDATLSLSQIPFQLFMARFSRNVASATFQLPFSNVAISRPVATLAIPRALNFRSQILLPAALRVSRLSAATRDGFLRLILDKSFLQDNFVSLFSTAITAKSTVPNRPYLPEIATFSLDYRAATDTVDPNARTRENFDSREIRLFHLHPFGQREEHAYIKHTVGAASETVTLFPRVADEGTLLLGLSGLAARQDISLLFQVRDGSANPDAVPRPVRWSVLASNHWRDLGDGEILAETTGGLLVSGHVHLSLPAATTVHNTLLEPGFVWLRASVDAQSDAVCRLLSVQPNAVPVILADPAAHLGTALPAGSIKSAVSPLREVRETTQPFASFGGATPESDRAFRNRAAERLRHRSRAVSAWDYERLVLQEFPQVHRAKCLPHTARDFSKSPGSVTVVVLPDTRGSAAASSLTPKTDLATLAKIDRFLATLTPPFVTAAAANPAFETVELQFKVAFRTGLPFASYREILRAEIDRFLAPWAHGGGAGPGFGGLLHRSALVARIDSLPYVDFLTDFELLHQPLGAARAVSKQTAAPSSPASILTSSGQHRIDPAR
ncbi:MAG: baseplate J/gp47 family protein [Verrucomicrobiota bacterium]